MKGQGHFKANIAGMLPPVPDKLPSPPQINQFFK